VQWNILKDAPDFFQQLSNCTNRSTSQVPIDLESDTYKRS
jgi:hypothetical protein